MRIFNKNDNHFWERMKVSGTRQVILYKDTHYSNNYSYQLLNCWVSDNAWVHCQATQTPKRMTKYFYPFLVGAHNIHTLSTKCCSIIHATCMSRYKGYDHFCSWVLRSFRF